MADLFFERSKIAPDFGFLGEVGENSSRFKALSRLSVETFRNMNPKKRENTHCTVEMITQVLQGRWASSQTSISQVETLVEMTYPKTLPMTRRVMPGLPGFLIPISVCLETGPPRNC